MLKDPPGLAPSNLWTALAAWDLGIQLAASRRGGLGVEPMTLLLLVGATFAAGYFVGYHRALHAALRAVEATRPETEAALRALLRPAPEMGASSQGITEEEYNARIRDLFESFHRGIARPKDEPKKP